jgi:nucleoside-diphosphate-sugar epimerase
VFVDDVAHAFALAAEQGDGHLLNIGTSVETSVNGLYQMLAEITSFTGEPRYGPARSGDLRRSALDVAAGERRARVAALDAPRSMACARRSRSLGAHDRPWSWPAERRLNRLHELLRSTSRRRREHFEVAFSE